MFRRISRMGLGAVLALLSLAVFGGCPMSDTDTDTGIKVNIGKVEITNIPKTVGIANKDSFKVFVRVSTGDNATDGWVAKGESMIDDEDESSSGFLDTEDKPWNGTEKYNVAIVISPSKVTSWQDIVVYGGQKKDFSPEKLSFNLAKGFVVLNTYSPTNVKQLFNGEDTNPKQDGIICVPESGIDYPGKPKP